MITGIEATNFRGWTGGQILTGFDIILGSNRIGKTSRIDAIQFAIFGRIPGFSGKEPELYAEINGPDDGKTVVTIKMDHPLVRGIDRALVQRDGEVYTKLTIDYTDEVPPEYLEDKGLRDNQSNLIRALRPAAESFDLDTFRELSGPDRERTLLKIAGGSKKDNDDYRNVLEKLLLESKAGKKAIREVVLPKVMSVWPEGGAWNTGILAIERELMDLKKDNQTEAREAKAAVKKIGGDEDVQGSLPEIEDQLKTERTRKAELDSETGGEAIRVKSFDAWEAERVKVSGRMPGYKTDIEEAQAELNECSDKAIAKIELNIESLQTDRDVVLAALEDVRREIEPIEKEREAAIDPKLRAKMKLEALETVIEELRIPGEVNQGLTCPLIMDTCTGDITIDVIHTKRKEAAEEYDILDTQVEKLEANLKELTDKEESYETEDGILDESIKDAKADLQAKHNRKPEIEANLNNANKHFNDSQSRLAEMLENKPPLADTDRDTLDEEIEGIDDTIETLEKKHTALMRVQEQERQRLKLRKRVDEIAAELKVINEFLKLSKQCMEQFKEQVRGTITDNLSILRGYWKKKSECPLPVIEFRAKDFFVDGIRFNSISGAERIMAGLSIAMGFILMRKADLKILMIDDVQIVDPKNWKIIGDMLMKALRAGDIDNVLVAGVACSEPKGSKTWNLDAKT